MIHHHHHGHTAHTRADACLRPLPSATPPPFPAPNTIIITRPDASAGPRPIGSILDEILASPGGLAGEARRILAAKGGVL